MKLRFIAIPIGLIVFTISCIQPKYGINAYDEKKNITNYYLISYGGLVIPGKWERDTHEKSTNQYSLIGPDSTNRLFISMSKPQRSILGFSPYTETYNYIKSEVALSQDNTRQDIFYGDSTIAFETLESDSINNFIISKYTRKRGRLTSQSVELNGIKKKN